METKNKYCVVWNKNAARAMEKVDNSVKNRIINFLKKASILENPKSSGRALEDNFAGLWRYRVGQWRIIVEIKDKALIILAVTIAKRDTVYKH